MDALIGEVLQQVRGIARDVLQREGVRLRTATVTGTDPLRIMYDGEDAASVVPPRRAAVVSLGDRVVVAKSRGQATIIGVLGVAPPPSPSGWERVPYVSGIDHAGHGYYLSVQRDGDRRYLRGRVARVSGDAFTTGSSYVIGTLDEGDWPTQVAGGIGQISSFASPGLARVEFKSYDGSIHVGVSHDTSWIGLDSITWDVK